MLFALVPAIGQPVLAEGDSEIDYAADVKPILAAKCWNCHGPDAESREADLRLDLPDEAEHVLRAHEGDLPGLISRILSTDPDTQMPPAHSKKPLSSTEMSVLKQWVNEGAAFDTHWAFETPVAAEPPAVHAKFQVRNAIDRFVVHRLSEKEMLPAAPASRETLIRRVSLDLTGLLPTVQEVDAFCADQSPMAYENLVDRLLASPRYGEHMAAAWLDASRYADTDGYQNDRYRYMHVWRDWVILALNDNQPYDQFLIEQIAGDMLPDATLKQQIATGFCRNHRINSEDGSIPAEWHVENVVDRTDTLGTAVLGLTIGCARCHDHKYDPLSAREYYQLYAYFNNVPEWGIGPNNGNSPPFVKVPQSWPNLSAAENVAQVPEALKLKNARKGSGNGLKRPQPGDAQTVMVMHEMETARKTYLLTRGQFDTPDKSESLAPAVPNWLGKFSAVQPKNRLELAKWIVHPQHPLTARVAVNRMWQRFFGVGLVKTAENFGVQGDLPSHPKLLDWLAVQFVDRGWDVKGLQKQIVLSATYRQTSATTPAAYQNDPENRLLARGPRYRMHPFVLRDSMLSTSGLLVEKIGGVPAKPYMPPKIWKSISNNKYDQGSGDDLYRRSLYTFWRRTIPPPSMVNFNAAEREVCVIRKDRTNTPLQALTMMNNVTFVEASRFLAEVMMNHSEDHSRALEFGFRRLVARRPTPQETQLIESAFATFFQTYRGNEEAAIELLNVGEKARTERFDLARHAALAMTASLMMNLDESITKE
ncbi:MAG: PSD1 and planctomycete cytochrome C domain-containing protein [Fuerstiella sp.]